MSRIIYPEDFASQRKLFEDILAKHTADGAASVITPYLTQQGIVLADDAADGTDADLREEARALLSKQSENFRQLRDLGFAPVFKRLKGQVQFLKGFYKPNVSALGDWGITVDSDDRIVYPAAFLAQHTVFTTFKAKYDSYAPGSVIPLDPYLLQHNIVLADDETAATAALTAHNQFQQAAHDAEDATQDRNNLWNPVMVHVRGIGDFLKKLYNDNAKQLGYWGFVVDDSPRAPRLRTVTVLPADQKVVNSVIVGGTLTNAGTIDVHIYRGRSTEGTPAIVGPGEMLGMTKGFSTITVVDPSTTEKAKIKVLTSQ